MPHFNEMPKTIEVAAKYVTSGGNPSLPFSSVSVESRQIDVMSNELTARTLAR
ncbi:hypothetical protein D3C78_963220 [compost metagenome]